MEEFWQREIDELEQIIKTNKERFIHATDPLQRKSLKEIIDQDTATLKRFSDIIASRPAQSKVFSPLLKSFFF
jgi:uncharacterized protein YjgD (DUF1641 family)